MNLWIYNLLIIIIFCSIGDQLLEVNRRSFENNMTLQKAITILMENTHLEMIVKSNLLGNNHKVPQLNFRCEFFNFWTRGQLRAVLKKIGPIMSNLLQALSKCLSKWIKVDKWDYFHLRSQEMEIMNCSGFLWFSRMPRMLN